MAPAPAAEKPKQWGPVVIGLVGGIIALLGAVIPWTLVQSCAGALGIELCISLPIPVPLGTLNPLLGIAPILALLTALVGIVLLFLHKPMTGMVAGLMGILSMLFGILFIVSFGGIETELLNLVGGGGSASIRVGVSFGVYLTIIGGLILGIGGFMQWMKLKGSAAAPSA